MIKKNILLLVVIFLVVMFSGQSAISDTRLPDNFSYLFHIYYDNGQLLADRDFEFKYNLIAEEYVPEIIGAGSPYKGEIINVRGKVVATFNFDPKSGNPAFNKGKISVRGPYFADASKINFYNDRGKLLLTLDVGSSSFCNDNDVCNKDIGENRDNCPADCKPKPTTTPPPASGEGSSRGILFGIVGVIIAVVIWIILLIIKKRKAGASFSPTLPPPLP